MQKFPQWPYRDIKVLATVVKVEQQISDGRQIFFKDMNRSLCSWLRWHGDVKLDVT